MRRKSYNNLSIDDPERELMDMHLGDRKKLKQQMMQQLFKYEVTKESINTEDGGNQYRGLMHMSEMKSDESINEELYSNKNSNSPEPSLIAKG